MAAKAQLLVVMSGEYRSKKEVAYLLVPAIGRKVIDLGGNLEKGKSVGTMLHAMHGHQLTCRN